MFSPDFLDNILQLTTKFMCSFYVLHRIFLFLRTQNSSVKTLIICLLQFELEQVLTLPSRTDQQLSRSQHIRNIRRKLSQAMALITSDNQVDRNLLDPFYSFCNHFKVEK